MNKGPQLILAGPGTGKTRYLVNKTIELITHNEKRQGIIVCTFTRKATEELTDRIYTAVPKKVISKSSLIIGTIHSICYELLTRYSNTGLGEYSILPEETQVHYIHSRLPNLGYSHCKSQSSWNLAENLAAIFNKITDEQIDYRALDFRDDSYLEDACGAYQIYQSMLKKDKLFDFATIQSALLEELENPDFLNSFRQDFYWILVDEYQDINNIQNKIFQKLSSPEYNLIVVGDDDQSIYGFRGSSVKHIREFKESFESNGISVTQSILNTNYRATSNLVNYTNSLLLVANVPTLNKQIVANRAEVSHEPVVKIFENDLNEAEYIISTISALKKKNIIKKYSDIALLFRSIKSHSISVVKKLAEENIPYNIIGGGDFFSSVMAKEYVALLDFYLGRTTDKDEMFYNKLEEIDSVAGSDLISYYSKNNLIETLNSTINLKKYSSCLGLTYSIIVSANFIGRYNKDGRSLGRLTELVLQFDDYSNTFDPYGLYSYLTFLIKSQSINKEIVISQGYVNIFTIHQAKGLEFPVVFMPSQISRNKPKGIIDRFNKILPDYIEDVDEELRVAYVGATRAEDLLVITGSKNLHNTDRSYELSWPFCDIDTNYVQEIDFKQLKDQSFRSANKTQQETILKLSYNKIQLYENCPLAYKYRYEWNLQTIRIGGLEFGSNLHEIIESLVRNIQKGQKLCDISVDELIENNWNNKTFKSYQENEKYKKAAKKQIISFIENSRDILNTRKLFAVEDKFNIDVEGNTITGRFDLVVHDNKQYTIIDFKTGEEKDYSSQLSFYSICFKRKYETEKAPNLAVYYLKSERYCPIEPNPEEMEVNRIKTISNAINNKLFPANPGKSCRGCMYSSICEYKLNL